MQRIRNVHIPQTLKELCDPNTCALLVYDMQVGVVRQVKNRRQLVANTAQIISWARKTGMRVCFVRHITMPKPLMGLSQHRMAMAWQHTDNPGAAISAFPQNSVQAQIVPELKPLEDEPVFDKITMSAFEGTPLHIVLRDCGINAFVLIGAATEVGIEPTTRHAADLGLIPILVEDACGYGDKAAANQSVRCLKYAGDMVATTTSDLLALS